MIFIILLLIFSFFCICQFAKLSQRFQKGLAFFLIFLFFLLAAFRYDMEGDWDVYSLIFNDAPSVIEIDSEYLFYGVLFEPGYMILNSLLKTVTNNSQMIFVVSQLIISSLFVNNLFRYSRFPILACFVYFGVLFLSLDLLFLRQSISVQLFIFGLKYIHNRKIWKYILIITVAVLFHYSAIILYPLYFFLKRRFSNRFIVSVSIIGFLLFLFQIDIISHFFYIIPFPKVHEYMNHSEYGAARSFGFIHIEIIVLLFLILVLRKKMNKPENGYDDIFVNLFIFYVIIVLYTFPLSSFAGRVKFYFIFSYIYIIPELICCFRKLSNRIVMYFILTVYLLLYQANLIFSENGTIYRTYKNYLIENKHDNS